MWLSYRRLKKPTSFELQKCLHLTGGGVDEDVDDVGVLEHPADDEEVLEHLDVVEHETLVVCCLLCLHGGFRSIHGLVGHVVRLPLHLGDDLKRLELLVRRTSRESHDAPTQIGDVVAHAAGVGVIQDLLDEVDGRLGTGDVLLLQVLRDHVAHGLLARHHLLVQHLLLLERQARHFDCCDWNAVALGETTPQRRVPRAAF